MFYQTAKWYQTSAVEICGFFNSHQVLPENFHSVTKTTPLGLQWLAFPSSSDGKAIACHCKRAGFNLWVGKIPWRRKWQSTVVFLPGEFHGQRSLAGHSSQSRKESDMTEWRNTHASFNGYSNVVYETIRNFCHFIY